MEIASQVLGREIGNIAKRSRRLSSRILHILEENTKETKNSRSGTIMGSFFDPTVEEKLDLLLKLEEGIKERMEN